MEKIDIKEEPDFKNVIQQLQVNKRELQTCSVKFALFCFSHFGIFLCASAILNLAEMHLMHHDCQNKIHSVNAGGLQICLYQ